MHICVHTVILLAAVWACLYQEYVDASRIDNEAEVFRWMNRKRGLYRLPFGENDEAVTVHLGANLINVLNANTETNEIDLVFWPTIYWTDPRLRWSDVPWLMRNVTSISLDHRRIWMPDIMILESTSPDEDIHDEVKVKLNSDGLVYYVPAKRVRIACDVTSVDSEEGALCSIRFISWTHDTSELDLQFHENTKGFDTSEYFRGSKYEVLRTNATRHVRHYDCCPETYADLQFDMVIRRKR